MQLKKLLKDKKMNKKGFLMDIIVWIIICFVTLMFLGLWVYGFDLMTNAMESVGSSGGINITKHAQDTFGVMNKHMQQLHFIAFIIMFALAISILITNFFVKSHPVFFIVYILIIVVAVIFSVYISNAYEDILGNDTIGSTMQGFSGGNFIMENLPLWTTLIGFVGAIFLFSGIQKDRELGGIGV